MYDVSNALACQVRPLRALRANRVFRADEKRIRTENTVIDKDKGCAELLFKIVTCARMAFSSVRKQRSARTVSRPRNNKVSAHEHA
jgi:hypothetical protein